MQIRYTEQAEDDLRKLQRHIANRILTKMQWFAAQSNPLVFSKQLRGHKHPSLYRFEIGDYRTVCKIEGESVSILSVLQVGDRKDIYRKL
ncbi:type II toxin-antitoxin system RelE/ParE family toxin [Candidatus Peregrinibacteria bacterium]|nr:type II toxin-antitoxin system RelE/ParE family toxin [Candidatus Peregrinibacteria bacterium]MBI3815947.1 type II toxin-antitoxin system RelE/ParE family toxin [Candidatus Peregrinibacteria bacterium]